MPTPLPRSAGILLHPTSLPGPFGVGDLGPPAERWVRTLADLGQSWWQILPLGPAGEGNSPYSALSAFAGETTLLSPISLRRDGLLDSVDSSYAAEADRVDHPAARTFKHRLVQEAWHRFERGAAPQLESAFAAFCAREAAWLDDYAAFAAIRDHLGGAALTEWPDPLRRRQPEALSAFVQQHRVRVDVHRFGQYLVDRQWTALHEYARRHGVRIIGDVPIFVGMDSADVWAHPEGFLLDDDLRPTVVAGVPPDYFAADGQLWGNPLYDWPAMAADGYRWWTARLRHVLGQVDLARLDHFRGFAAAWHVPAAATTAREGEWRPGPGDALFERLRESGDLPIIAEDLGTITPYVTALRDRLGLPGMRVAQFGLGPRDNPHRPVNYPAHVVAYTGTHDNDTANGWYASLGDGQRHDADAMIEAALHRSARQPVAHDLVEAVWSSPAALAIAPLQDILGLGTEARMNTPGIAEGNWTWRADVGLEPATAAWLTELTARTGRAGH